MENICLRAQMKDVIENIEDHSFAANQNGTLLYLNEKQFQPEVDALEGCWMLDNQDYAEAIRETQNGQSYEVYMEAGLSPLEAGVQIILDEINGTQIFTMLDDLNSTTTPSIMAGGPYDGLTKHARTNHDPTNPTVANGQRAYYKPSDRYKIHQGRLHRVFIYQTRP